MGFFLDDEDEVAGQCVGNLISLAAESDGMAVEGSLLNRYFNGLFLVDYLLSLAGLALSALGDDLSLSSAGITSLLDLLVHAWPHLVHLNQTFITCTTRPFPLHPVQVLTP